MKMNKCFEKSFPDFMTGLKELASVSYSVKSAVLHGQYGKEEIGDTDFNKVMLTLMTNVYSSMIHSVDDSYGDCTIDIMPGYVSYTTCSGLRFGWSEILPNDDDYADVTDLYTFFIVHPRGDEECAAPKESTLRKSAELLGWEEK